MHDCSKTQEKLIDLIFDEIGPDQKRHLLAEVERCRVCNDHYRSMAKTLDVFDHATETAQPAENYWLAYEMKLRTKLIESSKPGFWARFYQSLTSFKLAGFVPMPVAAALIVAVVGVGVFLKLHQSNGVMPVDSGGQVIAVNKQNPTSQPTPAQQPAVHEGQPAVNPRENSGRMNTGHKKPVTPNPGRDNVTSPVEMFSPTRPEVIASVTPPYSGPGSDLVDADTLKHFEKAEVLLRSFRNTRAANDDGVFDLAYEKEQSQRLLNQNIVLRRSAEAKGNLPTEEMLGSLEPFLIDIANLPDKPAEEDIHSIKQRMQKREIVASLQIYSARTAPPSY